MYLLYRSRHLVSWLPAIVIAGCLLFVSQQAVLQVKPHYDDTAIELADRTRTAAARARPAA